FTLAVAALAAPFSSFLPALRHFRGSLALRNGGRSATAGRAQHRVRGGLVAAQIALALVVLAGSGLLLRTFKRLNAVHPGFDPANVSTYWISLPAALQKTNTAGVGFFFSLLHTGGPLPR